MKPALEIYLLGPFRIIVEGRKVPNSEWGRRKAKLLVMLLALQESRGLHREQLMEILFPDLDEDAACENLYRVVYAARRVMEPGLASYSRSRYLAADGKRIVLSADNEVLVDLDEFTNKARAGLKRNDAELLEAAARLYRGDLLADEPFEEWAHAQREQARELFFSVLRRLAEHAEREGEPDEAHNWLDKILRLEPADEAAHRAKMRIFHSEGDRYRALKQYQKCAEALRRELSVSPERETKLLLQKIVGQ